jgi:hypothetical protein
MVTTAAQAGVTTGTSIKTMLQIATPSTRQLRLQSWGYTVIDAPTGGSIVELLQTDVAATVTAHVASGVQPTDPNAPASLMTLGTSATGYTSTAEGTPTATRMFDVDEPSFSDKSRLRYEKLWLPGKGPIVAVSKFLRVRVTFGSAVNMICWIEWDE